MENKLRSPHDLSGTKIWEAYPALVGSSFEQACRHAMAHHMPVSCEAWYPPLNRWLAVDTHPFGHGILVYCRDITVYKRMEEALTQTKDELDARVKQQACMIRRLNAQLLALIARHKTVVEQFRAQIHQQMALAGLEPQKLMDEAVALVARELAAADSQQMQGHARHLLEVQEAERRHLAQAIHDDLGQTIIGQQLDVAWLAQRLKGVPVAWRRRLESMAILLDELLNAVHHIGSELRPRSLDDLGLKAAIESQLQEVLHQTGIASEVSWPLEALHAPAQVAHGTSLGLLGMHERAWLWGGELTIQSTPGEGTTVAVRLPDTASEEEEVIDDPPGDRR